MIGPITTTLGKLRFYKNNKGNLGFLLRSSSTAQVLLTLGVFTPAIAYKENGLFREQKFNCLEWHLI